VAVGTTVVRTLEHCALQAGGGQLKPHSGETEIFISPGFKFRLVGALLTNFHLPQSSLLMLVSAFAGASGAAWSPIPFRLQATHGSILNGSRKCPSGMVTRHWDSGVSIL
jgi:hypothetical protein